MTIRNWQESDEEISYSWPIAVGVGIGTFAGAMALGNYTDVTAAPLALGVILGFGVFLEWAFWGRDPGEQVAGLEKYFKPKRLLTNDEVFGTATYDAKTLGLTGLVAALEPTSLVSYAELGERFGLGPRKPKTAKSRAA